jgi:hypothetical protein
MKMRLSTTVAAAMFAAVIQAALASEAPRYIFDRVPTHQDQGIADKITVRAAGLLWSSSTRRDRRANSTLTKFLRPERP